MGTSEDREFDRKMLKFACSFGNLSKDHSTKVGFALLKENQQSPSIFSYNGLVSGANDDCDTRAKSRPEKYFWGEHAERNGLYEAARPLLKDTMIFCSLFPNMDSARAIIVTGIDLVVTDFNEVIHNQYLKMISEQNRTGKKIHELNFNDDVKEYARVREYFFENNIRVYHPSRKLDKEGSFLVSEDRMTYASDNIDRRFLRKSVEILDKVHEYAQLFSRRKFKDAAFILRKDSFKSVSSGSLNVPNGYDVFMNDEKDEEYLADFNRKMWYIEAVKDAIYNVLKPSLFNSRGYVSLCPCLDCAMALHAVGVKKVVTVKPDLDNGVGSRWKEHFIRTKEFYKQINMDAVYFSEKDLSK